MSSVQSIEDQMDLVDVIREMIEDSGINENSFYRTFQKETLPLETVKNIFQQYYYYIRTFPQILSGLAPRLDNELIRMKISRTVVSELGDNHGDAHYTMFEKSLAGIGVRLDDYKHAKYIPEAENLVNDLKRLFLKESPNYALGAHYVIEEFGFPMIVNLYEGFRLYHGWKHKDFNYFYLHILIECNHVGWIQKAMLTAAHDNNAKEEILEGVCQVLETLNKFWSGLNKLALEGVWTPVKRLRHMDFHVPFVIRGIIHDLKAIMLQFIPQQTYFNICQNWQE